MNSPVVRTSFTQIPQIEELRYLMSFESGRKVDKSQLIKNLSLFDMSHLCHLLESIGLGDQCGLINSQTIGLADYLHESASLLDLIIQRAFNDNSFVLHDKISQFDAVYNYLTEDDSAEITSLKSAFDYGFVFGSATALRTEKAIELYHRGIIKKIIISGKYPIYKPQEKAEAETLGEFAISKGVKAHDLVLEVQGLSVPDCVKRTLDLFEYTNQSLSNLLIITSPFAMRRAYVDWFKFTNDLMDLSHIKRWNSEVSEKYGRHHWYLQEETMRTVLNEFFKIKGEWHIDVDVNSQL